MFKNKEILSIKNTCSNPASSGLAYIFSKLVKKNNTRINPLKYTNMKKKQPRLLVNRQIS